MSPEARFSAYFNKPHCALLYEATSTCNPNGYCNETSVTSFLGGHFRVDHTRFLVQVLSQLVLAFGNNEQFQLGLGNKEVLKTTGSFSLSLISPSSSS